VKREGGGDDGCGLFYLLLFIQMKGSIITMSPGATPMGSPVPAPKAIKIRPETIKSPKKKHTLSHSLSHSRHVIGISIVSAIGHSSKIGFFAVPVISHSTPDRER